LTDLILCEILQGIRDEASFGRALREFRRFEIFAPGGEELAIAAARNYRKLRQRGHTVRNTIAGLPRFASKNGIRSCTETGILIRSNPSWA
jgi:hypothetical protein